MGINTAHTLRELADEAPWADDKLTAYDEAQFPLYLSLLSALSELATEEDICKSLLGIDARREPERARKCFMSHVKRARWLAGEGLHLLFPEHSIRQN